MDNPLAPTLNQKIYHNFFLNDENTKKFQTSILEEETSDIDYYGAGISVDGRVVQLCCW